MNAQDKRPISWGGLIVAVILAVAQLALGVVIAGEKFNIGPLAPTHTPTPTITPIPTLGPTSTSKPTRTPQPTATPFPALPDSALPVVDQAAARMRADARIISATFSYIGPCQDNTLITVMDSQLCIGLVLPDWDTPAGPEEGAAITAEIKLLLEQLRDYFQWTGRAFVFFMSEALDRNIGAAYSFYLGPDSTGEIVLWYTDYPLYEFVPAPAWLAGR